MVAEGGAVAAVAVAVCEGVGWAGGGGGGEGVGVVVGVDAVGVVGVEGELPAVEGLVAAAAGVAVLECGFEGGCCLAVCAGVAWVSGAAGHGLLFRVGALGFGRVCVVRW